MQLPLFININNKNNKILNKYLITNLLLFKNFKLFNICNHLQSTNIIIINLIIMKNSEQINIETMKLNSPTKSIETQSLSINPIVSLSHLTNTKQLKTDPLGLVIAKRKRKEMADPQIAEAIMSASKLPPPIVPETTNSVDVPEELLQILALAKDYDKDDTGSVEFFKNYSLIQTKLPLDTQVNNITYTNRKRFYKWLSLKKYFINKHFLEDNEETRTLVQNTVHTDEEWFMESFLHVLCILLIIITLPLSFNILFKGCHTLRESSTISPWKACFCNS
uniref:Uncharacterized protein n=1 Tax=Schistosoma japonicum TaxID=6182 RepID=C1L3Z4_SCHJA|nr:hypothetical protein [Schistosoma japonicum]